MSVLVGVFLFAGLVAGWKGLVAVAVLVAFSYVLTGGK